jgi:RNA polymerase sigma-70 factor (ECF subfamily)
VIKTVSQADLPEKPMLPQGIAAVPLIEVLPPAEPQPTADERLRAMATQHFPAVWRFLRRLGLSNSDVDDAAQEVMVVAAQKLGQILSGCELGFLLGTALRVARRARHLEQRHVEQADRHLAGLIDPSPPPDSKLDHEQECALLDGILQTLPIDLRVVFLLYEIEERTMLEIAEIVSVPPGTVASRLRRARSLWQTQVGRVQARLRFAERSPSGRESGASND